MFIHLLMYLYLNIYISVDKNMQSTAGGLRENALRLYVIYDRHQKTNEGELAFTPSQDACITDEKLELQLPVKDLIHFGSKTL